MRNKDTDPNTEARMSSQLEDAMQALITIFHKYSGREGDKFKLSKKELKDLIHNELGGFLETQKDMSSVDNVLKELDENGDGEVDFQEFVIMVATLTVACNTFFSEEDED
ncbi:protein S100-A1-like isoform X2 [Ambystoma mexicanum]|uniref:protein S100-A1-like isoform X2 n=1 Tax=Ambystoma mexicanum TaxID=8296 RepID=UPI0037E90DD4